MSTLGRVHTGKCIKVHFPTDLPHYNEMFGHIVAGSWLGKSIGLGRAPCVQPTSYHFRLVLGRQYTNCLENAHTPIHTYSRSGQFRFRSVNVEPRTSRLSVAWCEKPSDEQIGKWNWSIVFAYSSVQRWWRSNTFISGGKSRTHFVFGKTATPLRSTRRLPWTRKTERMKTTNYAFPIMIIHKHLPKVWLRSRARTPCCGNGAE